MSDGGRAFVTRSAHEASRLLPHQRVPSRCRATEAGSAIKPSEPGTQAAASGRPVGKSRFRDRAGGCGTARTGRFGNDSFQRDQPRSPLSASGPKPTLQVSPLSRLTPPKINRTPFSPNGEWGHFLRCKQGLVGLRSALWVVKWAEPSAFTHGLNPKPGEQTRWRREGDSNPRYGFPYTHFPGVRLQPLGHPS